VKSLKICGNDDELKDPNKVNDDILSQWRLCLFVSVISTRNNDWRKNNVKSFSQQWHDFGHMVNQFRIALANRVSKIILGKLRNERGLITRIDVTCPKQDNLIKVQLSVATVITEDISDLQVWHRYHRKAGVEKFFIYSFVDLNVLKDEPGLDSDVVLIPWSRFFKPNSQILALAHAIANFGKYTEFMAFIDPDEYMVPKKAFDIKEILNQFPESNGFILRWTCFSDGGLDKWPTNANLIETLTEAIDISRADSQMRKELTREKHIDRVSSVTRVGVHQCDITGINTDLSDHMTLNHYIFKSRMDLDQKIEIRRNETEPHFEFETWKRKRLEMHRFGRENHVTDVRASYIWSQR